MHQDIDIDDFRIPSSVHISCLHHVCWPLGKFGGDWGRFGEVNADQGKLQ